MAAQYAIGLMSGTSADGVDAALITVEGCGESVLATPVSGIFLPYSPVLRETLLRLAGGNAASARDFCLINRLLGEKFADACEALCQKSGVPKERIAFVGSHGHTFWHVPAPEAYAGETLCATLQLGDPSPICERIGCKVVSDFRVRDMAAGGQGAPLVPYTDFVLYRDETRNVALQNIGGIANVTFLPKGCALSDIEGFDTGTGNMVMDAIAQRIDPSLRYDPDGRIARSGRASEAKLDELLSDPYYVQRPPKSTGREKYGADFVKKLCEGLSPEDALATATELTARAIALSYERFSPFGMPDRMIVSGGGARNPFLMERLKALLGCEILTPEDMGWDSDMKEAVAFALLANDCLHDTNNNAPAATGAAHGVVMGRISR